MDSVVKNWCGELILNISKFDRLFLLNTEIYPTTTCTTTTTTTSNNRYYLECSVKMRKGFYRTMGKG